VVAIVMSQLIGQAREGARLARSREWEATHMYELISALSGLQDIDSIIQTLAGHILETFPCEFVEVAIPARPGESARTIQLPPGASRPSLPPRSVEMVTTRGLEGKLLLWFNPSSLSSVETRLLDATASQSALALERVRLTRSENKARVLEESDQLKSSLLNSVSHELRSPLAAIKASVSSLRSGAVDWDLSARQDLLATIEEETDALNLLVGNLLDMSRIEAGALKPLRRWNSLSEIALGVVLKMRKNLQDHRLELDLPADLPLVPTDFIMIQQVFTNLLSNSTKYAPPGTEVRISARKEGDGLHVQVINQGPSVPERDLERIFDKFYRITAAERVTGTGLGLSICKGIIEAHGGKIWAGNQPGFFVFHFTLPLTLNGALPESPREAGDG
jgi:two-component system sensor histidine kinase KdpD